MGFPVAQHEVVSNGAHCKQWILQYYFLAFGWGINGTVLTLLNLGELKTRACGACETVDVQMSNVWKETGSRNVGRITSRATRKSVRVNQNCETSLRSTNFVLCRSPCTICITLVP
jgi:hypothetical protein